VIVDYPCSQSLNRISPALFTAKKRLEGNTRPWTLFRHSQIADELRSTITRRQPASASSFSRWRCTARCTAGRCRRQGEGRQSAGPDPALGNAGDYQDGAKKDRRLRAEDRIGSNVHAQNGDSMTTNLLRFLKVVGVAAMTAAWWLVVMAEEAEAGAWPTDGTSVTTTLTSTSHSATALRPATDGEPYPGILAACWARP